MHAYEQLQYSQIGKGEKHIKGEKSPLTDDRLIFKTEFIKDVDWHVSCFDSHTQVQSNWKNEKKFAQ